TEAQPVIGDHPPAGGGGEPFREAAPERDAAERIMEEQNGHLIALSPFLGTGGRPAAGEDPAPGRGDQMVLHLGGGRGGSLGMGDLGHIRSGLFRGMATSIAARAGLITRRMISRRAEGMIRPPAPCRPALVMPRSARSDRAPSRAPAPASQRS